MSLTWPQLLTSSKELQGYIMTTNAFFEDVLARPYPSLDESTDVNRRFQFDAYQEALKFLLHSNQTCIHSVPAGAGSGKTRLLVAILNGLLRVGVPYDQIEAISFTNASANDFRRKHIEASVDAETEWGLLPENICFSTIHQCAMNVLRKLQPHMGGVAYYFEDARTGAQDDEEEERQRAVRLALYSSVVYSDGDESLLDTLANYAEPNEKRFILDDLGSGNHLEKAHKLIKEELASDAGLGAFTNMAEGGPDFCIAVATDALMRLFKAQKPLEEKRTIYGIPAYMAVDEAQDLDFLQLLFLRALAQNGTSIVLVGDSRQTLYEFRQSLSDYPFLQKFMVDFVKGTAIKASISEHALRTNYRGRKEIVDAAEDISDLAVEYSIERWSKEPKPRNLEKIDDPEHIAKGLPDIKDSNKLEKSTAAISVIIGEPAESIQKHEVAATLPGGALKLLPEFKASTESNEPAKSKAKHRKSSQIIALSGGHDEERIRKHLVKLYERSLVGETAAIITRNGIRDTDKRFIEKVIFDSVPEAKQILKLNLISPPKHTPLAEYWFPDSSGASIHELPFSSIMIAGALTFIFSSDRETQQRLRAAGNRELNYIFAIPNGIRMEQPREAYIHSIAEELKVFFGGLSTKATDLFPEVDESNLIAKFDELRLLVARFTLEVIIQYGRLLWHTRQLPEAYPCRFHHMASKFMEGRYEGMGIRPLAETKGYFKIMWKALASTRFALTERDRLLLQDADLTPEFMDADTSLESFAQSINDYCCVHGLKKPNLKSQREIFIKDRETIYDEFSQLWHIKTRTYLREIARCLGKEVRANPNSAEEAYRFIVWQEAYQNARFKSRINMTYKPDKNQYGGLFLDLVNGMKHDAVIQRRNGKSSNNEGKAVIDVTTIHSAKGLEWDHVMLFFPQPSPNDKDSSFKSCRDLIYVAITRAARTLTVVLKKRAKLVESPTDTGIKVLVELMHRWAEKKGYFNRELDWGEVTPHHSVQDVIVFDETSHSELERSQTCRMHHYFQDMRQVSTMVPLTPPSYAFFFHSTMSAICAAFINQRLPSRVDPSIEIAAAVAQIVDRNLDEDGAFRFLTTQVHDSIYTLMESMIPMYFLGDRSRHHVLLTFYTESFARQLAAIAAKSQLFVILKAYRNNPTYRVLIEKSVRKVLGNTDVMDQFLPIVGIPDIKITGPDLTYIADYKTIPKFDDTQGDAEIDNYEQMLSIKTQQQVNYYQGMVKAEPGQRYLAELLYVADLTLMEFEEIPGTCATLPIINQGPNYKIVAGVNHARVLYTDYFDRDQFDDTVFQIKTLREAYKDNTVRPEHMFQPVPLVGGGLGEVTTDQCRQCLSSVHCLFSKHLRVPEI
jgi:superfamily I DNA/RNA helicase